MKRSLVALLFFVASGCFGPHHEQKVRPAEESRAPVGLRPITADTITAENAHRKAEALATSWTRSIRVGRFETPRGALRAPRPGRSLPGEAPAWPIFFLIDHPTTDFTILPSVLSVKSVVKNLRPESDAITAWRRARRRGSAWRAGRRSGR